METPPPSPTTTVFLDAYRVDQPSPVVERWDAFLGRDDLPDLSQYAFAASALYSSHLEEEEAAELLGEDAIYVPEADQEKSEEELGALCAAYRFAMDHDLGPDALLKAHRVLSVALPSSLRGAYRNGRMFVRGVGGGDGYAAIEPEHVPAAMETFIADMDELVGHELSVERAFYHASLLQAVFLHIHPFSNGNGRLARLLEKWFLASHLGPQAWAIPSEHHYWRNLKRYYAGLNRGTNYYYLYYGPGQKDAGGIIPFLSMLPGALTDDEAIAAMNDAGTC